MKKSYFFYLVLASLLSWGLAAASTNPETMVWEPIITDQGGPDAFGYRWIDNDSAGGPTYNWIDITGYGTQVLGLADDNNIGPIPLGFEFPYYWYSVDHCWIGSNGYIEFLTNYNYAAPFANIPVAAPPNDYLACLGGDLDFTRGDGTCYYYSNNSDTFIVSWIHLSEYLPFPDEDVPDSVHTFQMILSAGDSSITYQYGEQRGTFTGGGSDVIGIENVNGQVGIQYLRANLPANHMYHDGLALRFHPVPDPGFIVHDAGMLNAFQDGSGANFIPNNEAYTVRAEVKNFGNQTESGIRCSCIIRRGTTVVYHDTIDVVSLNPSETIWLDFPDLFTPTVAPQAYGVTFATIMTGDANSTNNTLVAELDAYVLPQTMRRDDNIAETGRSWTGDFSGFAVEFQIPQAVKLDTARINIWSWTANGDCYVWILPDDGTGHPDAGNIIAGDTVLVTGTGWIAVDFTAANLQFATDAKFWVVGVHALQSTFAFAMDQTVPLSYRGWEFTGGYAPDRERSTSDIMFTVYAEAAIPGTIDGVVTDGTNPLDGVFVYTYDALDRLVRTDTSGLDGTYSGQLDAGIYRELFQKSGYQDLEITNIGVQWDSVTTVNAVMVEQTGCQYNIGDINDNGDANGVDVTYGVNYFKGFGPAPPAVCDCPDPNPVYGAGDVNGNCQFNGVDITYFVNYLKGLGPALTYCPSCPPNAVASPAPPLEPIGTPVLKSRGRIKVEN